MSNIWNKTNHPIIMLKKFWSYIQLPDNLHDIRNRLINGESGVSTARYYGVGKGRISDIKKL